MSPGQCYNTNTVPPSRYCMRFIIFAKLSDSLTTGYMSTICVSASACQLSRTSQELIDGVTYRHSLRSMCTDSSVVLRIPSTRYQHCRYQVLGWRYRVLELVSFNTGYCHMVTWTEVSLHLNVCFQSWRTYSKK